MKEDINNIKKIIEIKTIIIIIRIRNTMLITDNANKVILPIGYI